ncbi:AAA family ATPase [Actinomadura sp. NPDC048955]|uniref:ATP-dependent nuclease n=1 Tax=Actinomadura sp. NPDC048955 TaxID=3158228 RepID=UPI003404B0E2
MKYKSFRFRNFKGIENLTLPLNEGVTTLIGLNESGKTTILEAIFAFSYGAEDLEAVNPGMSALSNREGWIPISRRANYNENISVTAVIELDEIDKKETRKYAQEKHNLTLTELSTTIAITEHYVYEDSLYKKKKVLWRIKVEGTRGKQRKARSYDAQNEEWQGIVKFIKTRLPKILYFPDFLFDLPDRFELAPTKAPNLGFGDRFGKVKQVHEPMGPSGERTRRARNKFYRATFENIVHQAGNGANLDTHVIARLRSGNLADRRNLGALLHDMSQMVTETVFGGWNRIFGRAPAAQEIQIDANIDDDGVPFLELRIKGPDGYYDLAERSLGFRWFFMFLLMTSFQGKSTSKTKPLILLDEPASNLHSSAQAELLKSFEKLIEGCSLVYSTHSHHLINVKWLDSAYVVRNSILDSADLEKYLSARGGSTVITATRYRAFVSQNPAKTSYIQPVLDLLQHQPSVLEPVPNVALVEGKSDFFALRYANEVLGIGPDVKLVPGGGAGSLEPLIRLYIGWGKNFLILLDGDTEGEKQRQRYEHEFGPLVRGRIATLPELCKNGQVKELEDLFSVDDKRVIVARIFPDLDPSRRISKKNIQRSLVELYALKERVTLSPDTIDQFEELLDELQGRLTPNEP